MSISAQKLFIRILAGTALCVLAALTFYIIDYKQSSNHFVNTSERNLFLQSIASDIIYLDEVLTSATQLYISTGNPEWHKRYRDSAIKLDNRIATAQRSISRDSFKKTISEIEQSNTQLVKMEKLAFRLVKQNKHAEAQHIIYGQDYSFNKTRYSKAITIFTNELKKEIQQTLSESRAHSSRGNLAKFAITIVLLLIWIGVYFILRKYLHERHQAEKEIIQLNTMLEKQIETKTRELDLSKHNLTLVNAQHQSDLDTIKEQQLRQFFECDFIGMIMLNPNGEWLYFNSALSRITGYSRSELEKMSREELTHPDDHDSDTIHYTKLIKGEINSFTKEKRYIHKDGHNIYVLVSAKGFHRENGELSHLMVFIEDITEQKQAQEKIKQREEQTRQFYESGLIGMIAISPKEGLIDFNDTVCEMFGYSRAELQEKILVDITHPDDRKHDHEKWLALCNGDGDTYTIEKRYIHKDGRIVYGIASVKAIRDEDGSLKYTLVIIKDVTEYKLAEQTIRHHEKQLLQFFESGLIGMAMTTFDGRWLRFNDTLCEMLGYTREEFNHTSWIDITHPDDIQTSKVAIEKLSSMEINDFTQEKRYVHKDGHTIHALLSLSCVRSDEGTADHLVAFIKDITEYKQAQELIREREEELSQLFESELVGIAIYGDDKNLTRCNDALCNFVGYTRSELQELSWTDITHADDLDEDERLYEQLSSGEFDTRNFEKRYIHKQGQTVYVNIWSSCTRKMDGSIERLFCLIQDITEQKMAENALRRNESLLRDIINLAPVPIMSMTRDGVLRFINQKFTETFGYITEEVPTLQEWMKQAYRDPNYIEQVAAKFAHHLETAKTNNYLDEHLSFTMDVFITRKDGKQRNVQTTVAAFKDYHIATFNDVTEQLEFQRELVYAKEQAEQANRAKSQFLASMSHELRTPLNAIIGFSEILQHNRSVDNQSKQHVSIINSSGEHLLALINDILDMAKIEAGHVVMEESDFELPTFLDGVTAMLRLRAERKDLALDTDYADFLPEYIRADQLKLRQVLMNLLSNAVKFTHQGRIVLKVDYQRTLNNKQSGLLNFEVHDTGPGISAEELGCLFEPFTQTETGRKSQEGTGLGLSLSKRFVDALGGELAAASEPGHGTVFRFAIPVLEVAEGRKTESMNEIAALAPGQPEYTILIVEDIENNRTLLINMLENVGFKTITANNGKEGVEQFVQHQPALILMDILMPVMGGKAAIEHIRKLPEGDKVKIMAVTASVFSDERQDLLDIGCDEVLFKPFREAHLFQLIQEQLDVEFDYADSARSISTSDNISELSNDLFQCLSEDWLAQLRRAAIEGDIDTMQELIQALPDNNNALQEQLLRALQELAFDEILAMCA